MDLALVSYNLLAAGAAACLPPVWLGSRLSGRWGELWPRLGLYGDLAPAGPGPRVWLQAVSVGEAAVARALADELLARCPRVELTVTASTATGLARARETLAGLARVAPFPLDLPWPVQAAARKIRPQVYASLETEIWPNLLACLQRRGASLLLLNGRISPRSFPRYMKLRPLIAPSLARFDRLSMISPEDARRAEAILGGPSPRVQVGGNAKYAGLVQRARPELLEEPAARLALGDSPLLTAGSVRSGEEDAVLGAFQRVLRRRPDAVLAVAPRHVERSGRWLAACAQRGLSARAWSELSPRHPRPGPTRVAVIDAMGVLFALYGLSRAAFVGASLVPLGGQNPMEPAAWGRMVCHGPSMEDFQDARQALEAAGGSRLVRDQEELARTWLEMLENEPRRRSMGRAARRTAARESGAAARAAELILECLEKQGALP